MGRITVISTYVGLFLRGEKSGDKCPATTRRRGSYFGVPIRPTWCESDPKSTSSRRLVSKTTWLDLAKNNRRLISSRLLTRCPCFQRSILFQKSTQF